MEEELQGKLLVWRQLYRQCKELERHLRAATSSDRHEKGADPIQAQLQLLKARTDAAFKDVSEAL